MGIFAGHPWREVERIEERVGSHGARYWWLTLSCGHFRSAARPSGRFERVLLRRNSLLHCFAPKRLRCLHCAPGGR